MKNLIKQFLKPDWRKAILLAIFLILSTLISHYGLNCITAGGGCSHIYGFPFAIYSIHFPAPMPYPEPISTSFNPFFIVLNIFFWYLISCLIISTYDKCRNTKQ
ncbi:MAG: hypothetical protein WBC21_02670 [Minisyncoccales bacterium]